ncbi:MAG TPA: DUF177 domain-containing protein [Candidatus Kryptonia bacterium]
MKINISNLSEGVHEYDFAEEPSSFKLDERFSGTVTVHVKLEKRSRQLFLTGQVRTAGRFSCDRCLDDFRKEIKLDYRMAYLYNEHDAGEMDKDEITVIHASTNEIEIDEDVREYILLAVPLKLLCRDDCAGLCPSCGANLNHGNCNCPKRDIDPRWEQLKKMVNNN